MLWCLLFILGACAQAEVYDVEIVPLPTSSGTDSRIIGGTPTTIEQYPFTVQVLYNTRLACGGTLLNRRIVLSAAHCFFDDRENLLSPRHFSIRVGSTYANMGGAVHSVSAIAVHERYNTPLRDNDVAVLLLTTEVTLSDTVGTTGIAGAAVVLPDNSSVVHVGWGTTSTTNPAVSPVLNQVTVFKINHTVCAERYEILERLTGVPYPVTNNMLCAGIIDVGGKDACQGDSGGPLLFRNVVVGITSWGYGCGEAQFPGVSARVSNYNRWIRDTALQLQNGSRVESASVLLLITSVIFSSFKF